jgi:hypothetical protein
MVDKQPGGADPLLSEMSEATPDLSIENKEETSGVALHHLDIPVRKRCGIRRVGRKYRITFEYWVPCKRRRCTLCAPKLVARRMGAVDDVVLYGREVALESRNAVKQELKRAKQRGDDAAYIVIPTGYTTLLYVSEAEIGYSIDRDVVSTKMLDSKTEWGNITSSKDWRPLKGASLSDDGSTDCGIVTRDQDHFEQALRFLGLDTIETLWDLRWYCDDAKHLDVLRAGGVMSDAEYWSMLKVGHLEDRKPNPWGLAI